MKKIDIFKKGLFKENPVFVLLLGMCSVLGCTSSLHTAIVMGVCVIVVLLMSNIIVSLLRKIIPNEIRIPVYIIIVATLVTCVDMIIHATVSIDVYSSLRSWIGLIVVNCIILGRAESFASKNSVLDSILDALGMGLGYTFAVLVVAVIRCFIGTGGLTLLNPLNTAQTLFSIDLFSNYSVGIFTDKPGAFLTLGLVLAFAQFLKLRKQKKGEVK